MQGDLAPSNSVTAYIVTLEKRIECIVKTFSVSNTGRLRLMLPPKFHSYRQNLIYITSNMSAMELNYVSFHVIWDRNWAPRKQLVIIVDMIGDLGWLGWMRVGWRNRKASGTASRRGEMIVVKIGLIPVVLKKAGAATSNNDCIDVL